MKTFSFLPAIATLLCAFPACKSYKNPDIVHRMGDRVQAGSLIYNVLETDWKSQLGEEATPRVPKSRFLVIRLTVTNSGGRAASIPSLVLEDLKGRTYHEESDGDGVTGWFGIIRRIDPAQTDDGKVLFDVPPAEYRLRVSDDADLVQADERYMLISIPLNLDPGVSPNLPIK